MVDWKQLLDKNPEAIHQQLTTKQKDPVEAHRKTILKNIDKAKAANAEGKKRGGIFKHMNEEWTRFELSVGRNPKRVVAVNGKAFNMVPRSRFSEFLDSFKGHVAAGQLDPEIRLSTQGTASARTGRSTGTRKQRNETPEQKQARMAKRAATLAAKKAR